jgi:acetyl-CoA C-acetyltransferase
MRKAVIVSACRTPIGKFGGTLKDVPAAELCAAPVSVPAVPAQLMIFFQ